MPGTMPTVDDRDVAGRQPEVAVDALDRGPHRGLVGERLAHAHEHDVATAGARRAWPAGAARTTCSTISPVVRWRSNPAWPVAQNPHAIAQPAWLDTQTVARSGIEHQHRLDLRRRRRAATGTSPCRPSSLTDSSHRCQRRRQRGRRAARAGRAGRFVTSSGGRRAARTGPPHLVDPVAGLAGEQLGELVAVTS